MDPLDNVKPKERLTLNTDSNDTSESTVETNLNSGLSSRISEIKLLERKSQISPEILEIAMEEDLINSILTKGQVFVKSSNKFSRKPRNRVIKVEQHPLVLKFESKPNEFKEIPILSIEEIRLGINTTSFDEKDKTNDIMERAFSIIYKNKGKHKDLNLIAPTNECCNEWVYGLTMLINQESVQDDIGSSATLEDLWNTVDIEKRGSIDIEQLFTLVQKLRLPLSKSELKSAFKVSKHFNDSLKFDAFARFYRNLKFRPEIANLFHSICQTESLYITQAEFKGFLQHFQKEDWTEQKIDDLFHKFSTSGAAGMDIDHFSAYLVSSKNKYYNKSKTHVVNDNMDRPLNEYFINSSHNTYLLGDQLAGESSVEGYIRALRRGCKCVEIDCWDGPNGQPVVYHGRTLTTKIMFQEVVVAIKKYAFVASDFPVILSFETHCSVEQQLVMAQILEDVLGDLLLAGPIDNLPPGQLPSPSQLMGKILIKGKVFGDDVDIEPDIESPSPSSSPSANFIAGRPSIRNMKQSESEPDLKSKKKTISPSLAKLVYYTKGKSSKKLEVLPGKLNFDEMYSLTDRKSIGFLQKQKSEFCLMTKTRLLRIYPSFVRLNSSNYDPLIFWAAGVQLVALNFQTHSLAMELNNALFDLNGACGYVLKPDSFEQSTVIKLKIKVISAQQIHKLDSKNVFVPVRGCVEIESITPEGNTKYRTMANKSNSLNPLFFEDFEIKCKNPKLCFLRFAVVTVDDQSVVGSTLINVLCLQKGYRHIPLNDKNGERLEFSSIFALIS